MKKIILLIIAFAVLSLTAQEKSDQKTSDTIKTKVWEWHYDNGILGEKGHLKGKLKVGEWKWYFKNKQLKAKGSYKLGKPIGLRTFYYPDGNLYCKGQYAVGKRNGKWIWYYEDNKIQNTIVFDKGMVKSYTVFDETGTRIVKSKGSKDVTVTFEESYSYLDVFEVHLKNPNGNNVYFDGQYILFGKRVKSNREGEWKTYKNDGSIYEIEHYKNDKLHGIYEMFFNGKVRYKWTYKNDQETGRYCSYYEDNGKEKNKGRLKNGKQVGLWKSYYNTGKLETRRHYKNGKLEGNWKEYDKNGKLKEIIPYKNGKINGNWKKYDETGKLKEITPYKNGKINGNWKKYDENGVLKENTYIENGNFSKLHETFYYPNGQIYKTGHTNNGIKKYGVWKWFYEDGKLKEINHYKDGMEDGENKSYYPNGNLKSEGQNKKGERVGWFIFYKEDGKPQSASAFKYNSPYYYGKKEYYDNGQLKSIELYYRPGVVAWEYYYPNGQLKKLAYYKGINTDDDNIIQEKTGIWKIFAKDGTLLEEIPFKDDKRTGKHSIYHNGKIYKTQLWENGKLKEVLSCVDKNGKALPKGTLKDGNGEVYEYNEDDKLMNRILIKNGRLADGHTFIGLIWNNQEKLNSAAWNAYEHALTTEKLNWALLWAERSVALDKNYYNMDTYAALLFKTGKKQKAIKIANEAIAIAKKQGLDYKITKELIKNNTK